MTSRSKNKTVTFDERDLEKATPLGRINIPDINITLKSYIYFYLFKALFFFYAFLPIPKFLFKIYDKKVTEIYSNFLRDKMMSIANKYNIDLEIHPKESKKIPFRASLSILQEINDAIIKDFNTYTFIRIFSDDPYQSLKELNVKQYVNEAPNEILSMSAEFYQTLFSPYIDFSEFTQQLKSNSPSNKFEN